MPKSHIQDQEEFKVNEILPEDIGKVRKEEYCNRCARQKSALHHLSFAYESRELSRTRGHENQTKNSQLCFAHKNDGYRRDDKDHQSGRILGGERFEGGMRMIRSILFF